MKMDIFFGNMFWGILLILFGISIVLKSFNIHLPLVKTFIAIIIILFGIRLLFGWNWQKHHYHSDWTTIKEHKLSRDYTVVFSSNEFDMTNLTADSKDLEITAVFGSATVLLPDSLTFDIESTAAFGVVSLPNRQQTAFGSNRHIVNSNNEHKPIHIEATAVFGRVDFITMNNKKAAINNGNTVSDDKDPLN